ncbi:unnamed protein product [Brachionus calyciflorus]|uniref:Membrane-bound transcription factor site-1 protease n=1 Tax=Brachionus calyciflorus TaxID=104777 RepID=A0A813QVJ9_9BILA|nr:unnamed protein product [Brachionus calyciflorus]
MKIIFFKLIYIILLIEFIRSEETISIENEPNEYSIHYFGYFKNHERIEILRNFLRSNFIDQYEIKNKNSVFIKYPSDFDVVKLNQSIDHILRKNNSINGIRDILPHKKVLKKLQFNENDAANFSCRQPLQYLDNEQNLVIHSDKKFKNRQIFRAIPKQIINQLNVKYFWEKGFTGNGINVAIFDTGLEKDHPHFKNVIERIDFTDENNPDDKIGHGTFVCGVIASHKECLGLAPDANIYIFKVFTNNQVSYTSWFLDAFNYAIKKKIHVLNLSIGGPDFMDLAFVEKVREVTSNGIIMVSGIGNDGPLYGTLNNPADQLDVIGVGGINSDDQIAKFSSRGMTTWELPFGYGRVKPDIVTYGTHVRGSKRKSGCRTLSGTSVASPIVAGAIALLLSSLKKSERNLMNPGSVKQILMSSADRLKDANLFEQGYGKLNLIEAYKTIKRYKPQASAVPSYIDLTECPLFWPYCSQPLYYTGIPVILNITILNGMSASGKFSQQPKWNPSNLKNGNYLKLSFSYSTPTLWPWSGYLAIEIKVDKSASDFDGLVDGVIKFEIGNDLNSSHVSEVKLYLKARIIPTPPRKQRILWDQFHNLRYPSGYFPRDDLKMKNDPLDWNADHIHTNFKDMYHYLRNSGYYIESLGNNYNCFDAENYGILMIVDPEDEFHKSEIQKIYDDVTKKGLSLMIFADWFNTSVIKAAKFYEENTRKWLTPLTGGANIPSLNEFLEPYGIAFSDRIYEGEYQIGDHTTIFSSGVSISKFPQSESNYLISRKLRDQGEAFLADYSNKTSQKSKIEQVPILGLVRLSQDKPDVEPGRIVVYGDSNCIDSSHIKKDCFWLLSALIEFATHNVLYSAFKESTSENFESKNYKQILRLEKTGFENYSKILDKEFLACKKWQDEPEYPIDSVLENELPNQDNNYNFLNLGKNFNLEDFKNEPISKEEYANDHDQQIYGDEVRKEHEIMSNEANFILKDYNLLFFQIAILVLVLIFCYVKFCKNRLRGRIKRSNYKK